MKTYSGELKDGMPYKSNNHNLIHTWDRNYRVYDYITEVYHDNEWQLYKPQPKKAWGIPELNDVYYTLEMDANGGFVVRIHHAGIFIPQYPVWLSKEHAEQHAKAENYINEFRVLSDTPVDGVEQWIIDYNGKIFHSWLELNAKLKLAICGYVANSRKKAERDLAAFPKIALAHKIVTWGFHGIVEEVL